MGDHLSTIKRTGIILLAVCLIAACLAAYLWPVFGTVCIILVLAAFIFVSEIGYDEFIASHQNIEGFH